MCRAWQGMRAPGEDFFRRGGTERAGIDARRAAFYRGVVDAAAAEMPGGKMRFAQFATLTMAMTECNTIHQREMHTSNWAPFCGIVQYRARGGGCDCGAIVADFARRCFVRSGSSGGGGASLNATASAASVASATSVEASSNTARAAAADKTLTGQAETVASIREDTPLEEVVRRLWRPGGFIHDPNVVTHHLPGLREKGERQAWGRFLMYLALHDENEAAFGRQVAFGRAMVEGAAMLAEYVAGELAKPLERSDGGGEGGAAFTHLPGSDPLLDSPAEVLLVRAGQLRQEVIRRGPERNDSNGGATSIALVASAAGLRWGSTITYSTTLFAGKYGPLWNLSLSNRVAEGKDPFFEPLQDMGLRGAPPSEAGGGGTVEKTGARASGGRARLCGATVIHVVRPWAECEAAIVTKAEFMQFLNAGVHNVHSHFTDGVYRVNRTHCLVVLNKAIARPPAAALLNGVDCVTWYGSMRLQPSAAFFGAMNHPSPLALRVVAAGVMSAHVRRYHSAAAVIMSRRQRGSAEAMPTATAAAETGAGEEEVSGTAAAAVAAEARAASREASQAEWETLRLEVARLLWFVWSTAPYGRGAPTIGLMTHHALYTALFPPLHRGAALLCLPRLKVGVYTDWEAMSAPAADDFAGSVYWTLWDDDARHMLGCLRRELERSVVLPRGQGKADEEEDSEGGERYTQ